MTARLTIPRPASACLAGMLLAAGSWGSGPGWAAPGQPPAGDPVAAPTGSGSEGAARDSARGPVEYLWVVRTSLVTREDCVRTVERARQMGVRGLLVQVVGRGDAYYRSDVLPRAEAIREPDLDPLGTLIPLAHEAGLEVHAWMNCLLVWSDSRPPRHPRHVLNAHPEWVARLASGTRLSSLGERQWRAMGIEGVFLAPANPGVRTWVARVAREIALRYAVDGIHLDYIRAPGAPTGYDPTTRARFALSSGFDPGRWHSVPAERRTAVQTAWAEFQREQITAVVREVRDSLSRVTPGLPLSAAVLADTASAWSRHSQDWGAWLRQGLIDRAYVMCYAPGVQDVLDQLALYARQIGVTDRVVPGIAVYNARPGAAAAKVQAARALGYPVLALYSYDALQREPAYWPALRELLKPRPSSRPAGGGTR